MRIPAHGEQRLDPCRLARLYVGLAEVTVVAEQRLRLAQPFGQGRNLGQHRFALLLVVGRLDHSAGDHQQAARGHHSLGVIALLEAAARNRHDARFFVRQIELIRWPRPFGRWFGRLAAGLLAGGCGLIPIAGCADSFSGSHGCVVVIP